MIVKIELKLAYEQESDESKATGKAPSNRAEANTTSRERMRKLQSRVIECDERARSRIYSQSIAWMGIFTYIDHSS